MSENKLIGYLSAAMLELLEETFENAHGIYLDRGTSLFETMATITAEEASHPVSANCASIAAHVEHTSFYMETIMRFMNGEQPKVDWTEIWRTVREVTPQQWEASQQRLRDTYQTVCALIKNRAIWKDEDEVGEVLGILMHNAYHLGEIRQALCTIKPER